MRPVGLPARTGAPLLRGHGGLLLRRRPRLLLGGSCPLEFRLPRCRLRPRADGMMGRMHGAWDFGWHGGDWGLVMLDMYMALHLCDLEWAVQFLFDRFLP